MHLSSPVPKEVLAKSLRCIFGVPRRIQSVCFTINGLCASLFLAHAGTSFAYQGQVGEFDVRLSSTVTVGTSWRVEDRDRALFGQNNTDERGVAGTGGSNTGDDGNLNFDKGDTFSTIVKGVHDFELSQDNIGFFGRVNWFYDYALGSRRVNGGHEPTGNIPNSQLQDQGFHPNARFDGVNLSDAYGFWNTVWGDRPLDLRVGRQVIRWGESSIILSPISALNTVDVSAFRRPGASLKEGFTPSEMLYANLGLTDETSLEAFYQLKWRKTVIDGCGTYFSTSDFSADGCDRLAFANSAGLPDSTQMGTGFGLTPIGGALLAPVRRTQDAQPSDSGQFGLALRRYFTELDVEFGVYAMQYHSRLPLISVQVGTVDSLGGGPNGAADPYALGGLDGRYYIAYPEDIQIFGLSAVTNLGGWAVSGEVSHTKDLPIQYNANDLLSAALFGGLADSDASNNNPLENEFLTAGLGQRVDGFERFDVTQLQSTFIKTFDRVFGSSRVFLIGEVAGIWVAGLPEALPGQRFGRSAVFGNSPSSAGFVTDFSWGYRLRSNATYRDVVGSIDFIPSLAWSHDVEGYSPTPGQAFNEGRRSVGLGLTLEFDPNTRAEFNYTRFADSAQFDPLRDRDFMSMSLSKSF